jgi:hypothetical protein
MRSSKYPLEICGCTLPFWYSTLHQISEGTAPDLNLLTAARSQGRIDVVIKFFLFGGDAVGLSVAICYGVPKAMHLLVILQPTIESSLWCLFVVITLPSKILNQVATLRISFPQPRMSIVIPFVMKPYRWRRLSDNYAETLHVVLLFETLLLHRFERVFPRLFASIARFYQPWAKMKVPVLLSIIFNGLY